MLEAMNRMMLAGLGALTMTKERAEQIFDEYVQRGKVESDQRQGFVKDLMDTADKGRKELEQMIHDQVRQSVAALDLATKDDLSRLEAKIDALQAKLES